jgi:amino acid adenylation domain-containing protein
VVTAASNLVAALDAVAARYPDHIAVRCGGQALTYQELVTASLRLAARMATATRPDHTIALLLPRSEQMIAAALAVLRVGSAYLPLDPEAPAHRLAAIVDDAAPSLVVTTNQLADAVPAAATALLLDEPDELGPTGPPDNDIDRLIDPSDRAYVIYTSGTTGRPKGIEVSHTNVLRLITTTQPLFGFGPDDVWTMTHSFAFDFSVYEMWGPLLTGGCVVVVEGAVLRDPVALRRLLQTERVTMLSQTPTAFNSLVSQEDEYADRLSLRWVTLAGEALRFKDLRPWVAKYGDTAPQLINMYGITETTVHASYRRIFAADLTETASLIGHPLPDLDFLLWDENERPVPPGRIGEIIVTGPGVALGYLRRPELTAQRFITVPDARGRPVRGYRSGDLARQRASGEYEYHGRNDDQVKIRGHRLELGEVHAALIDVPGVRQVAVATRNDTDTGTRVVAYAVANDDVNVARVRSALEARLPAYAVPSALFLVDALPRNVNGKLDRDALPDPDFVFTPHMPANVDDVERELLLILAELLPGTQVDRGTDFFDQGGNSLLATRLLAAVRRRFGVTVPLHAFVVEPTLKALTTAIRIERHNEQTTATPSPVEMLELGNAGTGAPVVALPGVFGIGASMARLSTHVRDRPFYALDTRNLLLAAHTQSAAGAAQACLDVVLPVSGPGVHLVGHSMGGPLALHLVRALQDANRTVHSVALLDAPSPHHLTHSYQQDDREQLLAFLSDVTLAFPEQTALWRAHPPLSVAELDETELMRWATATAPPELTAAIGDVSMSYMHYRTLTRILADHVPPIRTPSLLLVAGAQRPNPSGGHTTGWELVLPNLQRTVLATDHEAMLREPAAATVAKVIIEFQRRNNETGTG